MPCVEDRFGPSAPDLPAATLEPGEYRGLVLCPGRSDSFAFATGADDVWRVRVAMDLDVEALVRLDSAVTGETENSFKGEVELLTSPGARNWRLEIAAEAEAPVRYALLLEPLVEGCVDEAGDELPWPGGRVSLCAGGRWERTFEVANGGIQVCGRALTDGSALLELGPEDGTAWALGMAGDEGVLCRAVGTVEPRRFTMRWTASRSGPVRLEVELGIGVGMQSDPEHWQGDLSLTTPTLVPEASDRWAGEVRAGVALDEGAEWESDQPVWGARTTVNVLIPARGPDRLQRLLALHAEARVDTVTVRVSPGVPGAAPWSVPLAAHPANEPPPTGEWRLSAEDTPSLAALHVSAVAEAGVDHLLASVGFHAVRTPPVHYRWSPGAADPCGTCFVPGSWPYINLSGRPGDPDEWDDAIILHELGHWATTTLGRDDSPGGFHDGSRVAGALAWSEGFADFHAAWQLDDPVLIDRRADRVITRDLDALSENEPLARGTSDGTTTGLVSERLVAALLWDLYATDRISEQNLLGAALWAAAIHNQDRGSPGMDLVDYLDILTCLDAQAGEIASNLATERGFPYDPADCPQR